ncbi:TetR/AcrR family transcriptional regulator [Streptomyces triticagri]|uniref:TetR/AcrR family transcriptional regulator n=1 Tax=Streptomyces triticagri TaxID=2293568 RepID=A0A372M3B7_9ACTN|nr:TetR/AcrR family transcriptional regulator [Streptomyces triticagri]RFU85402.1 TetR/AcrR family transcriptional regulator [Streptomyces triticagri]
MARRESGAGGGGEETASGLPVSLERAWGLRERPVKGPKPGLTQDRIVDAAVSLAEAEGLAAVSMGRVAKELGASTMSLYRYVATKNELYLLMQDAASDDPPSIPPTDGGWRAGLTRWALGLRAMYHSHLWMLRIPLSGPPASPKSVAWMEYALAALEGTGLDAGEQLGTVTLLSGYVRHEATLMSDLDAAYAAEGRTPDEVMSRYVRTLTHLTTPERHPAVTRLLATNVFAYTEGPEEEADFDFHFGLERVLDGVSALVDRRAGAGS